MQEIIDLTIKITTGSMTLKLQHIYVRKRKKSKTKWRQISS